MMKKIQLFQSLNDLDKSIWGTKIKIQNENSDLKLQSKNNQNYFFFFNGRISISGGDFVLQKKAKNKIYELNFKRSKLVIWR
jgi:hypothetical protein